MLQELYKEFSVPNEPKKSLLHSLCPKPHKSRIQTTSSFSEVAQYILTL